MARKPIKTDIWLKKGEKNYRKGARKRGSQGEKGRDRGKGMICEGWVDVREREKKRQKTDREGGGEFNRKARD